jgi:hypothetical protein
LPASSSWCKAFDDAMPRDGNDPRGIDAGLLTQASQVTMTGRRSIFKKSKIDEGFRHVLAYLDEMGTRAIDVRGHQGTERTAYGTLLSRRCRPSPRAGA